MKLPETKNSGAQMHRTSKLLLSLLIDFIGVITFSLPVLGELADLLWAPISAYLVLRLYGSWGVCFLAFFEEALPFTDVIPTATLAWFIEAFSSRKVRVS